MSENEHRDNEHEVPEDAPAPSAPDEAATEATTATDVDAAAAIAEAEALNAAAAMQPEEVLTALRERDEYLDALRRLQADFENYRKRALREQDTAADRAGEKLITKMLPVLDSFELGIAHEPDPNASPLSKLHDTLLAALEGEGLERIAPDGMAFDPATAEAVMHEEADADTTEPTVTQVLRAGYTWKGRVVRAAMVKVKG